MGSSPIASLSGSCFYVIFIDDHSRFTWFYPLRHKSDFFNIFIRFQKLVENQFSRTIKAFQADSGTEFTHLKFKHHLVQCGIQQRLSCPNTPNQNGTAKRKHRHITETGLTLLFHSQAPSSLWVEAFATATYVINRLSTPVLHDTSPFEVLYGKVPSYSMLCTFGCLCFPYLRNYANNKLSPKSIPCVFVGYSTLYKGFHFWIIALSTCTSHVM